MNKNLQLASVLFWLNTLATGSIIIEAYLTFWDTLLIIFLKNSYDYLLKFLLKYEILISVYWIGPWIGVGFELSLLFILVNVLWPIHLYSNLEPEYPDKPK